MQTLCDFATSIGVSPNSLTAAVEAPFSKRGFRKKPEIAALLVDRL